MTIDILEQEAQKPVVQGIAYMVFLIPAAASVIFGFIVIAQVLEEPGRELDMLPFLEHSGVEDAGAADTSPIRIADLDDRYGMSQPAYVLVQVADVEPGWRQAHV